MELPLASDHALPLSLSGPCVGKWPVSLLTRVLNIAIQPANGEPFLKISLTLNLITLSRKWEGCNDIEIRIDDINMKGDATLYRDGQGEWQVRVTVP